MTFHPTLHVYTNEYYTSMEKKSTGIHNDVNKLKQFNDGQEQPGEQSHPMISGI